MANPYSVTINNVATDGTNIYVGFSVFDGLHTFPQMQAFFPSTVTAAAIRTYMQNVANNQPTLADSLAALVNTVIQGQ